MIFLNEMKNNITTVKLALNLVNLCTEIISVKDSC